MEVEECGITTRATTKWSWVARGYRKKLDQDIHLDINGIIAKLNDQLSFEEAHALRSQLVAEWLAWRAEQLIIENIVR